MADINNYFVERKNQFHKTAYQKLFRANPFKSLVPMSEFDLSEGRTPTVRTLTHELPTSYPTSLTEVAVSTGTGNPECNPTATTVKRGEIHRTFKLYQTSFQTDVVCLSDLKRAHQAAEAVAGFERALTEYTTVWWGDWYRIQNIAMADFKVTTNHASVPGIASSTKANHSDVAALPTHDLTWDHLIPIYWELVRSGIADEIAVGRDSKGRPILPLYAGPGILRRLFTDSTVKEQVRYFDAAKNLQALGYDGAVNGFVGMLDLFPIRYGKSGNGIEAVGDLTATNMIYPTINDNATVGRKYKNNPNYLTAARGGIAAYEVVSIIGRNVYEAKYEAVDPSSFSDMTFKQQEYSGEFRWINTPTFKGDNDRGNLGYYLADIRCGAKPIFPEFAYSIVTKATDI